MWGRGQQGKPDAQEDPTYSVKEAFEGHYWDKNRSSFKGQSAKREKSLHSNPSLGWWGHGSWPSQLSR